MPTIESKLADIAGELREPRTNGYSNQPLVTTGGAATGYLPTGLLPTGYLPTGYLPTGAAAAGTGSGRGRSAATAVPTKAREATPRITNFNIESSEYASRRLEIT